MSDCINENKITRGTSKDYIFSLTDEDGTVISDLSTATEITFMLKQKPSDSDINAVLSLSLTANPTQILVDAPAVGDVTVKLLATNTELSPRGYVGVLKIEYPSDIVSKPEFFTSDNEVIDSFIIVDRG
jgi:hypothetical protein